MVLGMKGKCFGKGRVCRVNFRGKRVDEDEEI